MFVFLRSWSLFVELDAASGYKSSSDGCVFASRMAIYVVYVGGFLYFFTLDDLYYYLQYTHVDGAI